MSAFAIDHHSVGEQSPAGQCSPTSLYQNLQSLHLQPQQQQPSSVTSQSQFSATDVVYRPTDELVNGPYPPLDMVGVAQSFPVVVDALGEDPWIPGCSCPSSYTAVPQVHPNLQVTDGSIYQKYQYVAFDMDMSCCIIQKYGVYRLF